MAARAVNKPVPSSGSQGSLLHLLPLPLLSALLIRLTSFLICLNSVGCLTADKEVRRACLNIQRSFAPYWLILI